MPHAFEIFHPYGYGPRPWRRVARGAWNALKDVVTVDAGEDALAAGATLGGIAGVVGVGAAEYGYTKWKKWVASRKGSGKRPNPDEPDNPFSPDAGGGGGKRPRPNPDEPPSPAGAMAGGQSGGFRRRLTRTIRRGRKKNVLSKLVYGNTVRQEYGLACKNAATGVVASDFLVGEYDPRSGGSVAIFADMSRIAGGGGVVPEGILPMHCYDLNYYMGGRDDDHTVALSATNQCTDVNARAWVFSSKNRWVDMGSQSVVSGAQYEPRYKFRAHGDQQAEYPLGMNIVRDGMEIRMMLYGCTKMETEFDVKVIRIRDPIMCPDYPISLVDDAPKESFERTTFDRRWQALVKPYVAHPMMGGVEPQKIDRDTKRWFSVVASKRVRIGEQTGDTETIPCTQVKFNIRLNELTKYAWRDKTLAEVGDAVESMLADNNITGNMNNPLDKPYYTSRYYLLIRALAPLDRAPARGGGPADENNDGLVWAGGLNMLYPGSGLPVANADYIPSYDLGVRTFFRGLRNVV